MKNFFSVSEIAEILKVSRSSVLYYIKSEKLTATRVGNIYVISREDFGDFLKNSKDKKKKDKYDLNLFDY